MLEIMTIWESNFSKKGSLGIERKMKGGRYKDGKEGNKFQLRCGRKIGEYIHAKRRNNADYVYAVYSEMAGRRSISSGWGSKREAAAPKPEAAS